MCGKGTQTAEGQITSEAGEAAAAAIRASRAERVWEETRLWWSNTLQQEGLPMVDLRLYAAAELYHARKVLEATIPEAISGSPGNSGTSHEDSLKIAEFENP